MATPERDASLLEALGEGTSPPPRLGYHKHATAYHFVYSAPGGQKIRFQCTVHAAGGSNAAAERIAWLCYEQFVAGKTKEEVTEYRGQLYAKCLEVVGQPPVAAKAKRKDDSGAAAAKEGRKPKKAATKKAATKTKVAEAASSDSSDSDSSSSSDDGAGGGAPAAGSPASANGGSHGPRLAFPKQGRVAAKMLVLSGFRCPCHFALGRDCANRGPPAVPV
mmetsp:Transcript_63642/g.183072  ORF Transcript_63642/g.183072 Transcript_63642/m.183072 type:complete len:220 (-) Transcript_63642:27-686(-)